MRVKEGITIKIRILGSSLVVDFPPKVVVFIPVFGQFIAEGFNLRIVIISHREQLLLLFLFVSDFLLDVVDFLSC